MTKKEHIIAGNKAIALFMGAIENTETDFYDKKVYYYRFDVNPNPRCGAGTNRSAIDLEYHDRWEWLMPVVERIEKQGVVMRIQGNDVWVSGSYSGKQYNWWSGDSDIPKQEVIWNAVFNFIKWVNTEKSAL